MQNSELPSSNVSVNAGGNVLVLPCDPENFKDFVAGLLGRPQTITRFIKIPFDITRDDIVNIHHLASQRIARQNNGSLLSFAADISYSDNSAVTLNSFEDFNEYAEIKPLTCVGIHVIWTWLIKFHGREAPEKQEISISFIGSSEGEEDGIIVINDISRYRPGFGGIFVRISHTDRSWGSDIDSLLNGAIGAFLIPLPKWKDFAQKNSVSIAAVFGGAVAGLLSAAFALFTYTVRHVRFEKEKLAWASGSLQAIKNQLNYVATKIADKSDLPGILSSTVYMLALAIGIFFGFMVASTLSRQRPSFVLLTKETEALREKNLKKLEKSWLNIIAGATISLILAILSKIVAAWFIKSYSLG